MDKQNSSGSEAQAQQERTAPGINRVRRRLGKAALATPVIASLAARPAMACSISGFLSGNTSPGRTPPSCGGNGCTPGFWKNNTQAWKRTPYSAGTCSDPSSFAKCNRTWIIGGTKLSEILPTTCGTPNPFSAVAPANSFMLQVFLDGLRGGGVRSDYAFVCHYMAAILNASAAPTLYGSTVAEVQEGLCKAIALDKLQEYKDILANLNERGCMFNARGDCADGFVSGDDDLAPCIPACKAGYIYDTVAKACVPI